MLAHSLNATVSGAEHSVEMGALRLWKSYLLSGNEDFLNTVISFFDFDETIQIEIGCANDTSNLSYRIGLFIFESARQSCSELKE